MAFKENLQKMLVFLMVLVVSVISVRDEDCIGPCIVNGLIDECPIDYGCVNRTLCCSGSAPAPSCPSGWTKFQENCYQFVDVFPSSVNWTTARTACVAKGGDLTSVNSPQENQFLQGFGKPKGKCYSWIGLRWNSGCGLAWSDKTTVSHRNLLSNAELPGNVVFWMFAQCFGQGIVGKWNSAVVYDTTQSYICKRRA